MAPAGTSSLLSCWYCPRLFDAPAQRSRQMATAHPDESMLIPPARSGDGRARDTARAPPDPHQCTVPGPSHVAVAGNGHDWILPLFSDTEEDAGPLDELSEEARGPG